MALLTEDFKVPESVAFGNVAVVGFPLATTVPGVPTVSPFQDLPAVPGAVVVARPAPTLAPLARA